MAMSKNRSKYGDFFFYINSKILSFINEQLHLNLTQELYIRKMFSWQTQFRSDLESIENASLFWDDYEQKECLRCDLPKNANVSDILDYTLKTMFNEKGLLQFETENGVFIVHEWNSKIYFTNKRSSHYHDVDFYKNASQCIDELSKLFHKEFEKEAFVKNGYVDIFIRILFECLNYEYGKKIGYYNSDQKIKIGEFILQKYGVFGLLFLVLFYSVNGNIPTIQKSSFQIQPNIYMSSKRNIEYVYNLKERCEGAVRIIMVCYTGTSFFANESISTAYDYQWFKYYKSLIDTVRFDIVLIHPDSEFVDEMIPYKMKPRSLKSNIHRRDVIYENIRVLLKLMDKDLFPTSNINLYFVDFALTCSYFQCIFEENQKVKDNIKVDMYLPNFSEYTEDGNGNYVIPDNQPSDAELRQSFVVKSGSELYSVFNKNIEDIISHSNKAIINSKIQDDYTEMMCRIVKGDLQ